MSGLNFLAKLPSERLFQLFIDGTMHGSNEIMKFENREPGCIAGFFDAFAIAIENFNKPLDIALIKKIHETCTKNITKGFRGIARGEFRLSEVAFGFLGEQRVTEEGIAEFIAQNQQVTEKDGKAQLYLVYTKNLPDKYRFLAKFSSHEKNKDESLISLDNTKEDTLRAVLQQAKKIGKESFINDGFIAVDLLSSSKEDIKDLAHYIFTHLSDNVSLVYKPPFYPDIASLSLEVEQHISTYLSEVDTPNFDEKLAAIAKLLRGLQLLHPFEDGNGRVFINCIGNLILMQQGFPPLSFYEPNIFDLSTIEELVAALKEAMIDTLHVITNPTARLYGYKTCTMPAPLKNMLEQFSANLVQVINGYQQANPAENFSEQLKQMQDYLYQTNDSALPVFRACAFGDKKIVVESLKNNPAFLYHVLPANAPPLYRNATLDQIARKTSQAELIDLIFKAEMDNMSNQLFFNRNPQTTATSDKTLLTLPIKKNT